MIWNIWNNYCTPNEKEEEEEEECDEEGRRNDEL